MSTLSLFTSQILLWNYLFLLALKKQKKPQHLLNYSSQSASPRKTKLGGKKKEGEAGGGLREGYSLSFISI